MDFFFFPKNNFFFFLLSEKKIYECYIIFCFHGIRFSKRKIHFSKDKSSKFSQLRYAQQKKSRLHSSLISLSIKHFIIHNASPLPITHKFTIDECCVRAFPCFYDQVDIKANP